MRTTTSLLLLAFTLLAMQSPLLAAEKQTIRFTGIITDSDGKPLEKAKVLINRMQEIMVGSRGSNGKFEYFSKQIDTVTDSSGKFDLPLIFESVGRPQACCELWFEAKGYVRETRMISFSPVSQTNGPLEVKLNQGLVLAGNVHVGMYTTAQLKASPNLKEPPLLLQVTGKDYQGHFLTEPGGDFEIYVPAGVYQIRSDYGRKSVTMDGVKAGSTKLAIKRPEFAWTEDAAGKEFDELWQAMDRQYSYFFLKTNVDWKALKTEFRPKVSLAKDAKQLAEALQPMLTKLDDLHVSISYPGNMLGTKTSTWNYNGNGNVIRSIIDSPTICGKYAAVGRTKPDGFGYFLMIRQSEATPALVKQAAEAIGKLKDAPGFIVDLRRANGGSEPLAAEIAKLFCAKKTVYARSKYRNGLKHTDFGNDNERKLEPSEKAFTKPVVCLVGPGAVSSGEGFVKMMMSLPHVTTVGLPTRGASGNPKPWPMGDTEVVVTFSRWVDMLPNGEMFEGRGIPPDVLVDFPASAYSTKDPTLEKALEVLRQKVAEAR